MTAPRTHGAAAALRLAVLVGIGALAAGITAATLAAQATATPERGPRIAAARRAFLHADHLRTIACGDCHRPEERHVGPASWSPPDCAACHHGEGVVAGCTTCHARAGLAGPRVRATPLSLSVWDGPEVRDLPFDHARHRDIGCLECHRQGMTRPPEACASCHAGHHRPEAECASCHVAPAPAAHDRSAHLGCGGAGCHAQAGTPAPMLSRTACLVCHEAQREHRPDGVCAACHVVPRPSTLVTER